VDYQDYSGHGTMVAYLAKQMYGPAVIHSYCAMPTDPRTGQRTLGEYVNAALEAIIEQVKADKRRHVVNMSLGGKGSISVGNAAIMHGLIRQLVALDVPVVCSAGNDGREAQLDRYPSCFQEPICVSAVSSNGIKANFSTWHNEVDFAELGVDVPVIDLYGNAMTERGTSLAAPIVAGKIAAILGAHPTMTEPEVYDALKANAKDLGAAGYDPHCGWGWIASIDVALPSTPPEDTTDKEDTTVANDYPILKLIPKPRMSGDAVRKLQILLNACGIACDVDGIFGPATDTAVRQCQAASGLTVDGICGAKTWAALEGGSKGVPTPTDGPMDADKAEAETCWLRMMIGWRYVIGGQGHRLTRDYLAARYADKPAYFSGGRLEWLRGEIARADAMGTAIYCADCSGLFMAVNAQMGLIPIKDTTADGLWRGYCKEISISDLQPGDILFRKSDGKMVHMAVVGTDGVYEAAGTAYGVAFRPWSDMLSRRTWNRMTGKFDTLGAWTHAGRLKVLEG
jgi:cell wall-associated NlpC family hydrolase